MNYLVHNSNITY